MKERYIIETDLAYVVRGAVERCNSTDDLERYLGQDPHPDYRLVTAQFMSGSWLLVWELIPTTDEP